MIAGRGGEGGEEKEGGKEVKRETVKELAVNLFVSPLSFLLPLRRLPVSVLAAFFFAALLSALAADRPPCCFGCSTDGQMAH